MMPSRLPGSGLSSSQGSTHPALLTVIEALGCHQETLLTFAGPAIFQPFTFT
jgi:hypothetical protein